MAFRKKKAETNFDKLSAQQPRESVRYRDVYEDQQLERAKFGRHLTMRGRRNFVIAVGVAVFFLVYMMLSTAGYLAYEVYDTFTPSAETSEPAETPVVQTIEDMVILPTDAPQDVTWEDFKTEYFTLLPRDTSVGRLTDMYADAEGNEYAEADMKTLWRDVQAGKYLNEERQLEILVAKMRSENEYGLIPVSMAPMNISWNDFLRLYFVNTNSGSFVASYYDSTGTKYLDTAVSDMYAKVQTGEMGSGEISTYACIGGNGGVTGGDTNTGSSDVGFGMFLKPTGAKILISLLVSLIVCAILYPVMKRNMEAQDALNDVTDINQYPNDQHIALPEEIQRKFDWFPDVGAHCSVQVSSMISHNMLSNKGLKKIKLPRRADKDIKDDDGDIVYYKGEILLDDDGEPIVDIVPLIDESFGKALYDASGLPEDSKRTPKEQRLRKWYDTTQIPYNPGDKDREKLKGYATVADMINGDWELPEYEPQRPAGAYLVDTNPVNTMNLCVA